LSSTFGSVYEPGHGGTRHGGPPDGSACRGGRMDWGALATQASPRSSRQSGLVAVLPIVTHTPTPPHVAFPRAPPHVIIQQKGSDPFSNGLSRWSVDDEWDWIFKGLRRLCVRVRKSVLTFAAVLRVELRLHLKRAHVARRSEHESRLRKVPLNPARGQAPLRARLPQRPCRASPTHD
jgi:hypothetical protein